MASCNPQHDKTTASWLWDGQGERIIFKPTVEPALAHDVQKGEAPEILTNEYFKDIEKTPLIFAEDLVRAFSEFQGSTVTTYYVKFSTKSFELDKTLDGPEATEKRKIIRCDFNVVWSANIYWTSPSEILLKDTIEERTFSFRNFPVLIGNTDNPKEFRHLFDFSDKDEKWSIRMPKLIKRDKTARFSPTDATYTRSEILEMDEDLKNTFQTFIDLSFFWNRLSISLKNINITE